MKLNGVLDGKNCVRYAFMVRSMSTLDQIKRLFIPGYGYPEVIEEVEEVLYDLTGVRYTFK